MPILSYFVVMGTALTLLLLFVSSRLEPSDLTIETSQIVGVQPPFKAEPERSPYKITGTNFAAAYNPAPAAQIHSAEASKHGDRAAGSPQREKSDRFTEEHTMFPSNRVAENPHNELMSIH
jgi:hypothetical protein